MNYASSWLEEVRQSSPRAIDVAQALQLRVSRNRFGPCPICGGDDKRHPPVTTRDGTWCCQKCKEGGSVTGLVAYALFGSMPGKGDTRWRQVRAWFADHGWCSAYAAGDAPRTYTPRTAPPPEAPLPFPPRPALLALLRACVSPAQTTILHPWFRSRGWTRRLPAGVLPDLDIYPAFWPHRAHRLLVPCVSTTGEIVSMHGRIPSKDAPQGKTRWPYRCASKPLFFADPWVGRPMLRGEITPRRILIVEGVTSYLSACCHAPADTAIIGADNGSFPFLAETVIPRLDAPVYAAPDCNDPDRTGDRYWREIKRAVPRARRLCLPGRMDVADLLAYGKRCTMEDLVGMVG